MHSNRSNDRRLDYQYLFTEACTKELAKRAVSSIQPRQSIISSPFSPYIYKYNVGPAADLQILGFRGYVCNNCLRLETHYVAFPHTEGDGRIEKGPSCDTEKVKAAAATKLVDRVRVLRYLHDNIPKLLKEIVNSRTSSNNHLVALKLSSPQEETIKLPNPADPSKPGIVFPYSKQRHLNLEC
jgi:hypothetical protein